MRIDVLKKIGVPVIALLHLIAQPLSVWADDSAAGTSGPSLSPAQATPSSPVSPSGQNFLQRRRMRRALRQQDKLNEAQKSDFSSAGTTSIQKSNDRSIEIIDSTDQLDGAESKVKQERAEAKGGKGEKGAEPKEAPCLSWLNPLGRPKAILLCVHGLGLHSGSYEQFAKTMTARGYSVYAVDVRGFGSWMAAKGREKCDFKHCSDDVVSTLNVLRMANPGVPVFLLGESMGGAIALDVASEYPTLIDGLISAVPAAERFKSKRTDLKVFLHLLTGNRKMNVEQTVVNQATADPNLREEWKDDPLDRMQLSAGELMQFQAFMNDNHERAKKIDHMPVLLVQGGKDKLVKAEGTEEIFKDLVTPDKKLAMVNGAEHLVYEEGQFSKEVIELTDNWITQRLPQKDGAPATADLIRARQMMQAKQYAQALPLLQVICRNQPGNPEPFVMSALAYARTGRPILARQSVRKAYMIARNSKDVTKLRQANDLLLSLPPQLVAPILARQSGVGPNAVNLKAGASGAMGGMYKVLIFTAKWCEPCKDLQPVVDEAKQRFGKRVEFTMVDVEDDNSQELVERYHVSPIPTMIFLRPNGDVADYSVGFSGVSGMIKGIAKMLLPG